MDRRTVYLQELAQVSDVLWMQRNTVRGLGILAETMFGRNTIASTLDPASGPNKVATPGAGLSVDVPPLAIYEFAQVDPAQWSTLSADTQQVLIQGFNLSLTNKTCSLTTTAGQSQYFLIEGKLNNAVDQNPQVLPHFPVIQMITVAGSSTTVLKVASNAGVANGDPIIVQGIATASGLMATATPSSTDTITLSTALLSAPGTGITVRDVMPNNGNPLNGPNNSGATLNTDRVCSVTITVKAGVPGASPTAPAVDSGYVPLYLVGPIAHGSSSLLAGQIVFAPNSPFFPTLIGAAHHKGIPGQANKIDMLSETSYTPVNLAGDTMTGELISPHLRVLQRAGAGQGGEILLDGGSGGYSGWYLESLQDIIQWKRVADGTSYLQYVMNQGTTGVSHGLRTRGGISFPGAINPAPTLLTTVPSTAYGYNEGLFLVEGGSGAGAALNGFLYILANGGLSHIQPGNDYTTRQNYWRGGTNTNGSVISGTGFLVLPNGIKIVWGLASTSGGTSTTVTFPNSGFSASPQTIVCVPTGITGTTPDAVNVTGSNNTTFTVDTFINGVLSAGGSIYYIAIGLA